MKLNNLKFLILGIAFMTVGLISCTSCSSDDSTADDISTNDTTVVDVNSSFFTTDSDNVSITTVPCTLSDGTETNCFQIVTNSTPSDHQMGPWCPDNISDSAEAGGILQKVRGRIAAGANPVFAAP